MTVNSLSAFRTESRTLYAFGTIFMTLRVFSRTRMVGVAGYQPDDYIIFWCWICYTGMTVAAHMSSGLPGDTSHLTMTQRINMSPEEAALLQSGTKWFMVGWYTYVGLIWGLKLNMLFLYRRIVLVIWVSRFIVPTIVVTIATGMSIYLLLALACRPFCKLWQILPDPGESCMPQSKLFLITVLVFNLVTDICIILIPIPIIMPLNISFPRKIGTLLLFCAGIFTMIAALLRVYFILVIGKADTAAIWSCREDFVAIVIGQSIVIRPLFTRRFWGIDSSCSYNHSRRLSEGESHELFPGNNARRSRLGFRNVRDPYDISALRTLEDRSQEQIISGQQNVSVIDTIPEQDEGRILAKKEVDVSSIEIRQEVHR